MLNPRKFWLATILRVLLPTLAMIGVVACTATLIVPSVAPLYVGSIVATISVLGWRRVRNNRSLLYRARKRISAASCSPWLETMGRTTVTGGL
jgi:hypothetical protein